MRQTLQLASEGAAQLRYRISFRVEEKPKEDSECAIVPGNIFICGGNRSTQRRILKRQFAFGAYSQMMPILFGNRRGDVYRFFGREWPRLPRQTRRARVKFRPAERSTPSYPYRRWGEFEIAHRAMNLFALTFGGVLHLASEKNDTIPFLILTSIRLSAGPGSKNATPLGQIALVVAEGGGYDVSFYFADAFFGGHIQGNFWIDARPYCRHNVGEGGRVL